MAMTLTNVVVSHMPGGLVHVAGNATGDSSYATSGEVFDISAYINGGATPIVVITGDDGYVPQHNRGNAAAGLILFYEAGTASAPLDEVDSAENLSAVVCTFMAIGLAPQ